MDDGTAQRAETRGPAHSHEVKRLNWGCGEFPGPGWINSDVKELPGIDISCDIRDGLPLDDESLDYAVSIHALPEIPYPDLVPALRELRRVLKPGGVLRLVLPDLDRGIRAYLNEDEDYFLIPDEDAQTIGAKFIVQMVWYGYSRSLFTYDFTDEILRKAGFSEMARCEYRKTASRFPEIVELDSREKESLFVEATK
jgi:predicted SAM-dependent methyltransferase